MAVTNLHEAAVVLQGAYQAIEKLMAEVEPMERAYHQEHLALEADGKLDTAEAFDHVAETSGYAAFHGAVTRLAEFLPMIEDTYFEETKKRYPELAS